MEVYDQSSCFFKDTLETCNPSKRFDSKVLTSLLVSQKVLNTTITWTVMLNIHQS